MKNSKFLYTKIIFASLLAITAINLKSSKAAIPPQTYCEITASAMQAQIDNLQELIIAADFYSKDPAGLSQQEIILAEEHSANMDALLSTYGLTQQEYALHMGKHKREVDLFLEQNPDVKAQLEALRETMTTLGQTFEEKKQAIMGGNPLPPQ